jgi:hypothetical protein
MVALKIHPEDEKKSRRLPPGADDPPGGSTAETRVVEDQKT